jgi:hypothetical protein
VIADGIRWNQTGVVKNTAILSDGYGANPEFAAFVNARPIFMPLVLCDSVL